MTLMEAMQAASQKLASGELPDITAANVEVVLLMGVRIIRAPLPRDIRSALNAAVKDGRLGHLRKDGLLPEAYYRNDAGAAGYYRIMAEEERLAIAAEAIEAVKRVCL